MAAVLLMQSCSKEEVRVPARLETPNVQVRGLSSSSFHLMWPFVEGASSYRCVIGNEELVTEKTEILFSDMEPDTDYKLSVVAVPAPDSGFGESRPMMLNVHTGAVSALGKPAPVLVCAYKSKTIIRWDDVSGSSAYEYELDGVKGSVKTPEIVFTSLDASTTYSFSVKALSPDRYSLDSEKAYLTFTTRPADEDMPPVLLDVREAGADYVNVNIYALPDVGYYYDAVPANYLDTYGEEKILKIYSEYIIEAARKSGYGLGAILKFGSMNYDIYPVYPEMNYSVIAFGMDLDGNLTTGLLTSPIKTQANDANGEPSVIPAVDWFIQRLFLDSYKIYDCTNSVWAGWKGESVTKVITFLTTTRSFKAAFNSDIDALVDYAEKNGADLDEESLSDINSPTGYFTYYPVSPAVSYTLATIACRGGEKVHAVSTISTKASSRYYDWFEVSSLGQTAHSAHDEMDATITFGYDPSSPINLQLSAVRYVLKPVSAVSDKTEKELIGIVESEGTALSDTQLAKFNLSGSYGIGFSGLVPGERYVMLAVACTSAGDKVLRYRAAQLEDDGTKSGCISHTVTSRPSTFNGAVKENIVQFRVKENEK